MTFLTKSLITLADIDEIVEAFAACGLQKPRSLFQEYINEQAQGKREIWVTYLDKKFAGYVTLKWESGYEPFNLASIPEIMDLDVLPQFCGCGIGFNLLDRAEKKASEKSDAVGLGVGLYWWSDGGYGSAQRLYVKKGYMPDGLGVTYEYKRAVYGKSYRLDDELILWLTKKLN